MFDFGWSEIVVIGAIALVVIGPKDLPKALRTGGMLMRRARSMAREFQNSIDDMVREAELEDIRQAAEDMKRTSLKAELEKHIDPGGELKSALDPSMTPASEASHPAMAETPPTPPVVQATPTVQAPAPVDAEPKHD